VTQRTEWLTIGEPTGDGRVWAVRHVEFETGPSQSRDDELTIGTVPMGLLDTIDESEYLHSDGSLLLSALDDDLRSEIEGAFRPEQTLNELAQRAQDTTPTQALDGWVLDKTPLNAREWGDMTDRDRSTVARNAGRADD